MDIHRLYNLIFKIWRKKRHGVYLAAIQPSPQDSLIDVGGYAVNWREKHNEVGSVLVVNLHTPCDEEGGTVVSKIGDGCNLEQPDSSFSIGYSNSVIEHVGDWDRQRAFAGEIRRVAERLWVQTPAYGCPIEPHYLFPFIHWLPEGWRRRIAPFTVWGLIERPSPQMVEDYVSTIRLLKRKEMTELFPDCEIYTERLLGFLPKSYVAIRRAANSQ